MPRDAFPIQEKDWLLIRATIGLGDWLLAQAGMTDTQAEVIRKLQEALRRLPEPMRGLVASYGLT